MPKTTDNERSAALTYLRQYIREGDTIYTIVRHLSESGMYRAIDCYVFRCELVRPMETMYGRVGRVVKHHITWAVVAALGYRYDKHREALGVGGGGQDFAAKIVEELSQVLFGQPDRLKKEEI